jgi:hypothetical protein
MEHWASKLKELRQDVASMIRRGFGREARPLLMFLREADARREAYMAMTLTLDEAERHAGVTRRTVERWLEVGAVTQAGQEGAPRVYLCELPTPIKKMDTVSAARAQATSRNEHGAMRAAPRRAAEAHVSGLPELESVEIRVA